MTLAEFRTLYPEFEPTPDAMLAAALADAESRVGDSWGAGNRDEIVGLETAVRLAAGPMGRAAQLQRREGVSTYEEQLQQRKEANACILLRTGVYS